MAMQKPPACLEPGSIVEVEIEKLGRLIIPITEGPASDAR
jgi:2,4-diketo-3-deoxy-L-fuconate hydrolase